MTKRIDIKSSVKFGWFWSQLDASCVSVHTEVLWYNETLGLWMTLYKTGFWLYPPESMPDEDYLDNPAFLTNQLAQEKASPAASPDKKQVAFLDTRTERKQWSCILKQPEVIYNLNCKFLKSEDCFTISHTSTVKSHLLNTMSTYAEEKSWFGLVCWVLWHINLCWLFNAKSIFM